MSDDILERFEEGINKFNNGSFYECHDILEDIWFEVRGGSRRFYQGLIHLAVGFYHILVRDNPKGAMSQLSKGLVKLSAFRPEFQGVEIETLLAEVLKCIGAAEDVRANRNSLFNPALIPGIKFDRSQFIPQ